MRSEPVNWSGTGQLRGGRAGIWFFITALRVFGLRVTYALLVPPAIYFSFVSPDIPATMDYHHRVFGPLPRWRRRWLVFRHFLSFGRALIDRTAILAGDSRHFSFSFDGEEHLRTAVAEGRGVLLLAAHLGNWEAAAQMLRRLAVPINVAGFDRESAEIRSLLERASSASFRLLTLRGSPTDVISIVAALRRGEVVAMLGDRAYRSASARVPFLGGQASFPTGAYAVAAIAGAPLVPVFSLREPGGHYHLFGFPPQRPKLPPRRQRQAYLRDCAARFACELESVLKRDPLQWYNFYPFWDEPDGARPLTPALSPSEGEREGVPRVLGVHPSGCSEPPEGASRHQRQMLHEAPSPQPSPPEGEREQPAGSAALSGQSPSPALGERVGEKIPRNKALRLEPLNPPSPSPSPPQEERAGERRPVFSSADGLVGSGPHDAGVGGADVPSPSKSPDTLKRGRQTSDRQSLPVGRLTAASQGFSGPMKVHGRTAL